MVYIPISTGWNGASHQFLLFTRDNGSREIVRGGPERQATAGQALNELAGLRSADTPSPYGRLRAYTGRYGLGSPDHPEKDTPIGRQFDSERFDSYFKQTMLEGSTSDLEGRWADIKNHARAIDDQQIPYSPLGPNSNSLASESLRRAGIEAPQAENGKMWGEQKNVMPWAPGAGDRLESEEVKKARQIKEAEEFLERRPVGTLLASLKLASMEAIDSSSPRGREHIMPKVQGIGFGD